MSDTKPPRNQGESAVTMTEQEAAEQPAPEQQPAALEVVETPSAASAQIEQRNQAVVAAAEAAMAMPGMPGQQEFLTLAATARMLSLSGAAPKAVRNNPFVAFHVAMVGRDLGISASASIELIDVMEVKNGEYRLSLSPQLINGQIRRLGLGNIVKAASTFDACTAVALDPHGYLDPRCAPQWPEHHDACQCRGIIGSYEFTWAEARMAGLVGEQCEPGAHVMETKTGQNGSYKTCGCNQGYKTYPKRMMWWRAAGFLADDCFPEAGLGLYSPEALGAVVDENGRPIDPRIVELPEGYDDPKELAQAAADLVDPADRVDLFLRMVSLAPEQAADLRARWKQDGKLSGRGIHRLDAGGMRFATSLVTGMENKAKKDGYDKEAGKKAATHALVAAITAVVSLGRYGDEEPPEEPDEAPAVDVAAMSPTEVAEAVGEAGTDEEIAAVQSMHLTKVRKELKALGIESTDDANEDRKQLTIALLRKRLAAPKLTDVEPAHDQGQSDG